MKRVSLALALSAALLAGCDTPVEDDDNNWLAGVANPLIGTWGYSSTSMNGTTSTVEKEFKTNGTVVTKTTTGTAAPVTSNEFYLVKDRVFVVSGGTSNRTYTKYLFEVIDNNHIKIVQDGRSSTYYERVGAENQGASRTIALATSLAGGSGAETYWKPVSPSMSTMYDWYTFRKDGTYHVYHWMNGDKHYVDRGEFSYFIDATAEPDNLVSLSNGYTVTVYNLTRDDTANPPTLSLVSGSTTTSLVKFDGETFTQ